jgi:hypothetical protein
LLIAELLMVGVMVRIPDGYITITHLQRYPLLENVIYWTNLMNYLLPVVAGILIADRLSRDRRTNVQELITTLAASPMARMFGKYLGSTLATIVPIFLFYSLGIGIILAQMHTIQVIPLAAAAFATIVLPGILFVGAFSTALPALLWVPLYQFLFLAYWFWGNIYTPKGIPTISTTLLTPAGGYMSQGFFGLTLFPITHATVFQGVESLLLLLGLSLLIMVTSGWFLRWQQERQ